MNNLAQVNFEIVVGGGTHKAAANRQSLIIGIINEAQLRASPQQTWAY